MSFLIVVALRSAWLVCRRLYLVVVVLVDHLRERQEETQPANHHARTSRRCLAAPRPACETIRLMMFWSMTALTSAWFGRRRTHLVAKHRAVAILQDCPRGQETHGREWSEPLDGRDRCIKVVGVMHLMASRRQGMCRCRRHVGHDERHE